MSKKKEIDHTEVGKYLLGGAGVSVAAFIVTYLTTTNQFFCVLFSNGSDSTDCFNGVTKSIGWYFGQIALPVLPVLAVILLVTGLVFLAIGKTKK
jgi:hypothetical protein